MRRCRPRPGGFNENGCHKRSLDDAERLNVTKPTLYYYVKNKHENLFGCVRIGPEMLEAASARIEGSNETGLGKLVALWACTCRAGEPLPIKVGVSDISGGSARKA